MLQHQESGQFVANRIGEIQHLTNISDWHHVQSQENPADMLSCGINPTDLVKCQLWWHGPTFLKQDEPKWLKSESMKQFKKFANLKCLSFERPLLSTANISIVDILLHKFSNLDKICRILVYCLRFIRFRSRNSYASITHYEVSITLLIICRAVRHSIQGAPLEFGHNWIWNSRYIKIQE